MSTATAAPEIESLEHYRILREVGRGGMSVVTEAIDTRTGQRVALKRLSLPPSLSREARKEMTSRMNREARAVARLSHPNIVSILAVGEENGQPFLVMELLTGQTLRELLHHGPVPPEEAALVMKQAAAAVDAVHAAGVIHRDLKPSNLMLLPDGTVKLMGFGIARQSEDTLVTQAGTMVGSPAYMAPELINGDLYGPASDLWSLGIILYEMLAGRPPFGGDRIAAVLHQITQTDPPPLRGAPWAVQTVFQRALAKDPARRYKSAGMLAAAFRAARHTPDEDSGPLPRTSILAWSKGLRGCIPQKHRLVAFSLGLCLLACLLALTLILHHQTLAPVRHSNSHSSIGESRDAH